MAEVLLFHHAQGQTKGFHELADRLRAPGHTVHTPDLYDGRTFDDLDEGVGHARELGFDALVDRATATADELPAELVYIGLSLGVMPAQKLAQTRPGARGAVLLHACLPSSEFGGWPAGVPVQVHGMDADPEFAGAGDLDAAKALVAEADDAELFVYPGDGHLFSDSSLPAYDHAATDQLVTRVLGLLAER
jgi:dienelactone hydrolase